MDQALKHQTWNNLLRLCGENITEAQLPGILHSLNVTRLDELSEEQANVLIDALSPLPRLRVLLWERAVSAIETKQAKGDRLLAKVDPTAAADTIVPDQLDALAGLLVKQAQQQLFKTPGNI